MPYTPFANTDQGLATLGRALFPDPSVIAQTGYYGAAQREKMLSGNKLIDQQNAANQVLALTDDTGIRYAPPTFSVPQGSVPGAPAVINSPAALPVTPAPGSAPASLSGTVTTPAPAPVPGPPSATRGGTLDAGSAVKLADTVIANSNGADPPLPGLHPGTFQAPGGGIKQAPPAAPDGSPAPPLVNPSLFINMGVRAGYDASQLQVMGNAYVMQKVRNGQIDQKTGEDWMAGFGQAALVQARTSLATNAATNATTLADRRLQEAGLRARQAEKEAADKAAAAALPFTAQPAGPGTPSQVMSRGEAIATHAQPVAEPTVEQQARGLTSTQPNGPASPPVYARQGDVQPGTPVFNQSVYDIATKPISVVDTTTKQSGTIRYQDYLDAPPGKYIYNPASKEISPNEALQRKTVYNRVVQDAFPGIPQSRASQLGYAQRNEKAVLNPADDVTYTERANNLYTYGPVGVRGDPYAAGQMALKQLQQEGVIRKSVDREAHTDIYNPHIVEYQTDKGPVQYFRVPSLQEEAEPAPKLSTTIAPGATSAPANSPGTVPLTGNAPAGNENPGFLSTLFSNPYSFNLGGGTPAAAAPPAGGAMPAGAISVAPAGATEGQTVYGSAGTQGVVRGGFVYPIPQPAMQGH